MLRIGYRLDLLLTVLSVITNLLLGLVGLCALLRLRNPNLVGMRDIGKATKARFLELWMAIVMLLTGLIKVSSLTRTCRLLD